VGVYAQTAISPSDRWELRAGARFDNHNAPFAGNKHQVSPRVKLSFFPDPANTVYLYYARLFLPTNVEDLRAITSVADSRCCDRPHPAGARSLLRGRLRAPVPAGRGGRAVRLLQEELPRASMTHPCQARRSSRQSTSTRFALPGSRACSRFGRPGRFPLTPMWRSTTPTGTGRSPAAFSRLRRDDPSRPGPRSAPVGGR